MKTSFVRNRRVASLAAAAVPALLASTSPTYAQEAAATESVLEEIVVTAQFSQETRLQETPLAITAISGDSLKDKSIDNIIQVTQAAPNVNLNLTGSAFGPSMSAFIRGVGQGDFNFVYEPGVAIYADDVYFGTVAGSVFQLSDLERVEVLRGPQGTLFGKNSIGGAIRMISQKPKGDGSGYIEGTYGSFERMDMRGMFDVAITDSLFLRMSGVSMKRDGYVKRYDFACMHPDLGASAGYDVNLAAPRLLQSQSLGKGDCEIGTEGGQNVQGARAALRWVPSDSFEVNFTADWTDDTSEAAATKLLFADGSAFQAYDDMMYATYGVRYDERFFTSGPYSNYSTFDHLSRDRTYPPIAATENWGGALTIDWDISENVHLKSISGYRGYSSMWSDDQDASPLPLAYVYNDVYHQQFSQEIQLTGTAFGVFDWATGAYYYDGYNLQQGHVNIDLFNAGNFFDFDQNDPSNTENQGVFFQGTYHVTDALGVTAGVRYTEEDKDYTFDHGLVVPRTTQTTSYDKTDWKFGVDYKFTPDLMAYVQASTGFKGGGFNPRPFNASQVTSFGPETLTSYELGLKSEWFDSRLRANLAVYLSQYEDLQLSSATIDNTGAPFVGPSNVGEEELTGFELEIQAQPFTDFLIDASVGYTHAEYKELGSAVGCSAVPNPIPAPAPGYNCVTDNPTLDDTPGGPPWNANMGVQYTFLLGDAGSLVPRVDANYRDGAPRGNSNNRYPEYDLESYILTNARMTWTSPDEEWAVSGFVTNLTNEFYYVNYFNLRAFGEGMALGQPSRPREFGLTIRRNFR